MHMDLSNGVKSETRQPSTHFFNLLKLSLINELNSDNDFEFDMEECYATKRLSIKNLVCKNTSFQWITERKHQHILNVARAVLFQAKFPSIFWGDSVHTAVH